MSTERHLVIFARFPMAGAGKRRLAAGIGAVHAVRFQRVRLAHLVDALGNDNRWRTWLAVTPDRSGPWPSHLSVIDQGRGDLGQRLARVTVAMPGGAVVIVGGDIPGIRASDIAEAFARLAGRDAVFGPAGDGGYWLIGLNRSPRLRLPFANVRWSSEHALADTLRALGPARIARLRTLEDIDDIAALARHPGWTRRISAPPCRRPPC
jgi:uncharacterized protein